MLLQGHVRSQHLCPDPSFEHWKFWNLHFREWVYCSCCSITKSCLTLWLCGPQHARLPCPSLSAGVCSKSCPLSQWCHPTISSSVSSFSSCPQSFPASGSFPISQLFASGGQSIGASASATDLPMNIQGWFPLVLTGLASVYQPLECLFLYCTMRHTLVPKLTPRLNFLKIFPCGRSHII